MRKVTAVQRRGGGGLGVDCRVGCRMITTSRLLVFEFVLLAATQVFCAGFVPPHARISGAYAAVDVGVGVGAQARVGVAGVGTRRSNGASREC